MSADEEKQWVKIQEKAFTRWFNNQLRKKKYDPIEDASTAWDSGVKLMEVVNALYDVAMPKKFNPNPKMRPQQLDNLAMAFKMAEDAEIKFNFLQNHHLLDHNTKMILGMMWAIILDYAIKGISVDEMTAKEGLLLWVQKKTKGYNHVDPPGVKNFSTSFKSGLAFCALIHRHRPKLIDYDSLDPANDAENLELAFSVAEKELDIPRLLDVEDITSVPRPDEKSVMTYVAEYFNCFAAEDIKENAARRVQRFLNFMRGIEAQQNDYEARARALIEWCNNQSNTFGEEKEVEDLATAVQDLADFRSFVTATKPEKAGEKLDVEALFFEIQQELSVNNRRPYVPPEDVNLDAVSGAFDNLSTSEGTYANKIRENRLKFIERVEVEIPQEKIDEFTASFNHFDKDKSNKLDKIEFRAALTALSVPFKDDAAYEKIFNEVSKGGEMITLEQFIQFNSKLVEDKDTPEQMQSSFNMMADNADTISEDQLNIPPLTDEDREYLKGKMTADESGNYDYNAFIDSQFQSTSA